MLIYNIGETGVVQALTNSVPLTLYLVENYDVARKGGGKMFKNKELFRVVMIFVIGIILILMTPVLFKVVMELFSK